MISLTEKAVEDNDYREYLEIKINDKSKFSVYDGEPEDATLSRDFNDCWNIIDMLKKAHSAGVNGEPIETIYSEIDEF